MTTTFIYIRHPLLPVPSTSQPHFRHCVIAFAALGWINRSTTTPKSCEKSVDDPWGNSMPSKTMKIQNTLPWRSNITLLYGKSRTASLSMPNGFTDAFCSSCRRTKRSTSATRPRARSRRCYWHCICNGPATPRRHAPSLCTFSATFKIMKGSVLVRPRCCRHLHSLK